MRSRLELEDAVLEAAEPEVEHVEGVVLVESPRPICALLGQMLDRPLDVPAREIDHGLRLLRWVGLRRDDGVSLSVHKGEQPTHPLSREVGFEGPRGIRVPEGREQVGDVAVHDALVSHFVPVPNRLPIDLEVDAGQDAHDQARGGHDHVRLEVAAGAKADAGLSERLDVVRYDGRVARAEHLEQVAVRSEAEPLIPRVVARVEVGVDVDIRTGLRFRLCHHCSLEQVRLATGELVIDHAPKHVLPPRDPVGQALGQKRAQAQRETVFGGLRGNVRRRALEHRDVLCRLGERRHEGDGCGSTPDHHHSLPADLEVGRPELRVDHATLELIRSRPCRRVALIVVVVASAGVEHIACQPLRRLRLADLEVDRPLGIL